MVFQKIKDAYNATMAGWTAHPYIGNTAAAAVLVGAGILGTMGVQKYTDTATGVSSSTSGGKTITTITGTPDPKESSLELRLPQGGAIEVKFENAEAEKAARAAMAWDQLGVNEKGQIQRRSVYGPLNEFYGAASMDTNLNGTVQTTEATSTLTTARGRVPAKDWSK